MATEIAPPKKDEMTPTLTFLRLYRYLSFFCPDCEGEFGIEEAGQMFGTGAKGLLSEFEDPECPQCHNLVCPECGQGHLEVILGV